MALTKVNLTSTKSARTILLHADAKTKPGIHFLSLQATSRLGKSKQKKRVHFAAQVRLGHTRLTDGIVVLVY